MTNFSATTFSALHLNEALLRVLKEIGYETPSPIQAATIPLLLENRDVLGQAQTGTGKTAAFALPILSRINLKKNQPQALILTPTRELAIQVAEAFHRYATYLKGFHVLPIYGGQSYTPQLAALKRGVHVVVGTPGRIIDHIEKGSLNLSALSTLVLDEADEMLRMGFIDDVERILKETPQSRQTTLFSATMPAAIKHIAKTYLQSPAEITVPAKTRTAENINQRYWMVSGLHKLDALTRILEVESFDGMIIFTRTKLGTEELAERLQARGFSATAINGDMQQMQRERTIEQLKNGKIDILVATDVAARGLDVDRISHVINYDVPYDPESYTHRIGRTGRAGRSGQAILFITPREKNLLKTIERATRQPILPLDMPSIETINDRRIAKFKNQIIEAVADGGLDDFQRIVEEIEHEHDIPTTELAAALAKLLRGDTPLLINEPKEASKKTRATESATGRTPRGHNVKNTGESITYRIEVGHDDGAKPGNIVGAIANEAQLDSDHIGRIQIFDDFSLIDLPSDLSQATLQHLKKVWVAGKQLHIEASEPTQYKTKKTFKVDKSFADSDIANPIPKKNKQASMIACYRIEAGKMHQATPSAIVAALVQTEGVLAKEVGQIDLFDSYSLIDLPYPLKTASLNQLKSAKIDKRPLKLSYVGAALADKAPRIKKTALKKEKKKKNRD